MLGYRILLVDQVHQPLDRLRLVVGRGHLEERLRDPVTLRRRIVAGAGGVEDVLVPVLRLLEPLVQRERGADLERRVEEQLPVVDRVAGVVLEVDAFGRIGADDVRRGSIVRAEVEGRRALRRRRVQLDVAREQRVEAAGVQRADEQRHERVVVRRERVFDLVERVIDGERRRGREVVAILVVDRGHQEVCALAVGVEQGERGIEAYRLMGQEQPVLIGPIEHDFALQRAVEIVAGRHGRDARAGRVELRRARRHEGHSVEMAVGRARDRALLERGRQQADEARLGAHLAVVIDRHRKRLDGVAHTAQHELGNVLPVDLGPLEDVDAQHRAGHGRSQRDAVALAVARHDQGLGRGLLGLPLVPLQLAPGKLNLQVHGGLVLAATVAEGAARLRRRGHARLLLCRIGLARHDRPEQVQPAVPHHRQHVIAHDVELDLGPPGPA